MNFYKEAKSFFDFYMQYINTALTLKIQFDEEGAYLRIIQVFSIVYFNAFKEDNTISKILPGQEDIDKSSMKESALLIYNNICKQLENSKE